MNLEKYKPVVLTVLSGVLVKALLFAWAYLVAGIGPLDLMRAHDGAEYIEFSRIMVSATSGPLPDDVARHDPGLSVALAGLWLLSGKLASPELCALVLQLCAWLAMVVLTAKLCEKWTKTAPCNASVLIAATLGYPTVLYYGQFNLTEQLFTAMVVGSLLLGSSGKWLYAVLLAGFAATVRSTGLLLGASLVLAQAIQLYQAGKMRHSLFPLVATGVAAILPWLVSQAIVHFVFHSNASVYQPTFGLPFSGFRGIADAGMIRAAYILGAVGFFVVSTVAAVQAAHKAGWVNSLYASAALFSVLFLVFHLCLKTLYYIDHRVWTFDYQDRYFAPLWPIAIVPWHRWINWKTTALLLAGSTCISTYWLKNYLAAAGM